MFETTTYRLLFYEINHPPYNWWVSHPNVPPCCVFFLEPPSHSHCSWLVMVFITKDTVFASVRWWKNIPTWRGSGVGSVGTLRGWKVETTSLSSCMLGLSLRKHPFLKEEQTQISLVGKTGGFNQPRFHLKLRVPWNSRGFSWTEKNTFWGENSCEVAS